MRKDEKVKITYGKILTDTAFCYNCENHIEKGENAIIITTYYLKGHEFEQYRNLKGRKGDSMYFCSDECRNGWELEQCEDEQDE